jgi:SAM-dependent methyltransferase
MNEDILERHKKIWEEKKILRVIYEEWYTKILSDLVASNLPTIELGAGSGNFKAYKPNIIACDIETHPWIDMVFDAHQMPFKDDSTANIVMIDVLHHLSNPLLFLEEAYRVLTTNGRVILIEPFPTIFSLFIYKRFHPEPFIMDVDYFSKQTIETKHPWDSNQAIAYLLFFKNKNLFLDKFKDKFLIRKIKKFSFLLYPASGGFENKSLIADWLIPIFQLLETVLSPAKDFIAFRTYIVLEKK